LANDTGVPAGSGTFRSWDAFQLPEADGDAEQHAEYQRNADDQRRDLQCDQQALPQERQAV
jgi:hypothetical protein